MSDPDFAMMMALRQKMFDGSFITKLRRELAELGTASIHLLNDEDILRLTVCRYAPAKKSALPSPLPQVKPQLPPAKSPLPQANAIQIALEFAQEYALTITTSFEGSKPMDYSALAGDDFDGQGTSFGIVQWNFGRNTLGPLLKKMLAKNAHAFAGCFGADADYDTLKKALDDNNQANQLKWARDLQKNKKSAWSAAFKAIGAVDEFNRIQRQQASAEYHPSVKHCVGKLRGISSDLMKSVEFRSYAALFDLCIQQGSIDKAINEIKSRVQQEKPATQLDLLKITVIERAKKADSASVSDCISRRMGILTAAVYESTENNLTKKRSNQSYGLIIAHGTKEVAGL
jgi:hypothetical protein